MPVFSLKNFFGSKPKQLKKNSFSVVKNSPQNNISQVDDHKRRLFLKSLGVIGLGALGATVFPKKTHALVMGGTPATSVVGIKDADNLRMTPAKTGQLPAALTGSGNLKVALSEGSLTVGNVGLKNIADAQINPATQETVATLATDENLLLLRRMNKQLESLSTVDSATRQRVAVEAMPTTTVTGTITAVTNVNGFGGSTILPNLTALGGVDARYLYIDTARNAYANGIRNNL